MKLILSILFAFCIGLTTHAQTNASPVRVLHSTNGIDWQITPALTTNFTNIILFVPRRQPSSQLTSSRPAWMPIGRQSLHSADGIDWQFDSPSLMPSTNLSFIVLVPRQKK